MAQWLPPHQGCNADPGFEPGYGAGVEQPLYWNPSDRRSDAAELDALAGHQIATWRPYVWHDGDHVLILEVEPVGWVVAELRFDACRCQYVEAHRAIYHWAREAFGVFLARAMQGNDARMTTLASDLAAWAAMRLVRPEAS